MQINPYLNFDGNCREAFTFYSSLLGAKNLVIMTYAEMPTCDTDAQDAEVGCPEGVVFNPDHVMHARMDIGGVTLMASDSPPGRHQPSQGIYVNIGVDSVAEAERVFEGLSEGGAVSMPIGETFWAHRFGMVTDRFGTPWMINCEKTL